MCKSRKEITDRRTDSSRLSRNSSHEVRGCLYLVTYEFT